MRMNTTKTNTPSLLSLNPKTIRIALVRASNGIEEALLNQSWNRQEQDFFFPKLWQQAREIWDTSENLPGFEAYVSADYSQVLDSLRTMQGRADTFLEWGSGLGVVTIMASRLGFSAYGIEISPQLVAHARQLADEFAPLAKFAESSFVPNEYRWDPRMDDDGTRTDFESPDGYSEFDMRLADFDLVYAYPWPQEQRIFSDILRKHGRPGGILMTFDVREGMAVKRLKRRVNEPD